MFQLNIHDLTNEKHTLDISDKEADFKNLTIQQLKEKFISSKGLPMTVDQINLVHSGKQLENSKTIAHYKIPNQANIPTAKNSNPVLKTIRLNRMQKIKIETLIGKIIEIDLGNDPYYFYKTTVRQLKEKLLNYTELNKFIDDMRLKFEENILQDANLLHTYGIKNGSKLTCEKCYNIKTVVNNYVKFGIKFSRAADAITNDNDGEIKAVLSCGHAVDPNSLTAWCKSLIDDGKVEFICPAIVDANKNRKCNKKWNYDEVKRIALLNELETEYFEKKLSENSLKTYVDFKQCPNCSSFVERLDANNLRVKCTLCSRLLKKSYEFCWQCEREWTVPIATANLTCGRENCLHQKDLVILANCKFIKLSSCSSLPDMPSIRACPTCGKLIEHNGAACKNIICPRCSIEFCFACLELKKICQKTSPRSWYGKCLKPVAPIQTKIPRWNPFLAEKEEKPSI